MLLLPLQMQMMRVVPGIALMKHSPMLPCLRLRVSPSTYSLRTCIRARNAVMPPRCTTFYLRVM